MVSIHFLRNVHNLKAVIFCLSNHSGSDTVLCVHKNYKLQSIFLLETVSYKQKFQDVLYKEEKIFPQQTPYNAFGTLLILGKTQKPNVHPSFVVLH